jgi:hypothetical protein
VCYCIDEKEWKAAQVWMNQLFESYKAAKAVEESKLPNEYAEMLRKGL